MIPKLKKIQNGKNSGIIQDLKKKIFFFKNFKIIKIFNKYN